MQKGGERSVFLREKPEEILFGFRRGGREWETRRSHWQEMGEGVGDGYLGGEGATTRGRALVTR